jgi:hypothetical protein
MSQLSFAAKEIHGCTQCQGVNQDGAENGDGAGYHRKKDGDLIVSHHPVARHPTGHPRDSCEPVNRICLRHGRLLS